ncbi:hypothetical protein GX48_03447 [Paracoccidioides brasiliensis]|nr:hypothetical protein GX48_03447 [Paracoccidioides brasiliensis]
MPLIDSEAFGFPAAKRQKVSLGQQLVSAKEPPHSPPSSRIFSPFRTLGLVSPTNVPFTSIPLGKTTFQITTSIGRSLQTYDLRRGLSLIFLTRPQTPAAITAICAWKDKILGAWGGSLPNEPSGVWLFKRGKKVGELACPTITGNGKGIEPVEQLLVFGSWIVGCCASSIRIWKSTTFEHYTTLTPPAARTASSGPRVLTGRICTMPTYLNKIFAGRSDGSVDIWNLSTGKLIYTILPTIPNAGAVTALEPTMALSLLAIAYSGGALVMHNVRTDQPILHLRSKLTGSSVTDISPITSISFRTDDLGAGNDGRKAGVMATATADSGDITMWDLNDGGRITGVLRDAHESPSSSAGSGDRGQPPQAGISKIQFLPAQPVLLSTGTDNSLRSWIFDQTPFSPIPRPLHSRAGHAAPITTLTFLPAASDDSDTVGKWLLSSSRDRSLWALSLRKDSQNVELSQGNVGVRKKRRATASAGAAAGVVSREEFKTPEITCLACSLNRDGGMGTGGAAGAGNGPIWANPKGGSTEGTGLTGWESVVTGHRGDGVARTWFWGRKKAGRWTFATGDGGEVKSVAVSPCGTFALVGSAGGSIDMYNLQSGMHRQSFPARVTPAQARKLKMLQLDGMEELGTGKSQNRGFQMGEGKHTSAVTGLMVDALNTTVISCGLDGRVKFWNFTTGHLQHELNWHPMCSITGLRHNISSDLVALSCDDLSIRIIDIETRKLVRELWGCTGQINDFCLSNDGRWVIAASMDSVIRVWDLPTGHLIDAFRMEKTCTALALSVTGEFLATAHADGVGVNVWNNRSLFVGVPTKHIGEEEERLVEVMEPTASGEGGEAILEAAFEEVDGNGGGGEGIQVLGMEQLSRDMVTLSVVPKSRWQTLLHLDVIKERNKPKDPPKIPQKAPFFLPSTLANENADSTSSLLPATQEDSHKPKKPTAAERSRIAKLQLQHTTDTNGASTSTISQFTTLLHTCSETANYDSFIEYLKSLSPAKADLEIRSLDPGLLSGKGCNELIEFVSALTARLRTRRDFELVNAWMAVFLRVHGDVIGESRDGDGADGAGDSEAEATRAALREALREWKIEQEREGKRLAELVGYCRGIVGFLRSGR